jgi:hypothetical protein
VSPDTVQCNWCLQTVSADGVHSCFDAKKVADHRTAERAVLSAARAWWVVRGGPLDPARSQGELSVLWNAIERLVALELGA